MKNDLTVDDNLQMQIQQDTKPFSINTKKEYFEKIFKKEITHATEGGRERVFVDNNIDK